MVDFPLTTLVSWLSTLFVTDMWGSAVLAGIFGIIMVMVIAVQFKLGGDSLLVLGIFMSTLFSYFVLQVDLGLLFLIIAAIIVSWAILKLSRK